MERLIDILMELDDSIDWEKEDSLIDDRILDSFSMLTLISDLEDEFDIEIDASELIPENFNSIDAMCNMIKRLQEV